MTDAAGDARKAGAVSGTTGTPLLIQFLLGADVPCPRCGYNLRDLQGNRCPECGDELRLQVGLVEPRYGPYLAALSGACLGLGAGVLLGLVALVEAPLSWWSETCARLLLVLIGLTAVLVPALLLRRRNFRRRTPASQWTAAGVILALVVALGAGVIFFFDG